MPGWIVAWAGAGALATYPVGTCAETTSPQARPAEEVRSEACRALGQPDACAALPVEWFEASGHLRRLWVLSREAPGGAEAWSFAGASGRSAAEPRLDGAHLEPGDDIGEDALVPASTRRVPCGPLRPRWVDRPPGTRWRDAVLEATTWIDVAKERSELEALDRALDEVVRLEVELDATHLPIHKGKVGRIGAVSGKMGGERVFVRIDGAGRPPGGTWLKPDGARVDLGATLAPEHEAALRRHGWRRVGEPPALPPHVEALRARDPLLEKLLAPRGLRAPATKTIATYREAGGRHRYVLTRTDYVDALHALPEPTRSRVWAIMHR